MSRILCKYRTCNYNLLGLERGMWLCEICDLKDLGDEYHYICVCKNKNITTLIYPPKVLLAASKYVQIHTNFK